MSLSATDPAPTDLCIDPETGESLYGSCSHCRRRVDNHDVSHRVTAIIRGGRGVECTWRGDIPAALAQPLGFRKEQS